MREPQPARPDINITPLIDVMLVLLVIFLAADLQSRLRDIYRERRDKTMYIIAAPTLRYGRIIDAIDSRRASVSLWLCGPIICGRTSNLRALYAGKPLSFLTCRACQT